MDEPPDDHVTPLPVLQTIAGPDEEPHACAGCRVISTAAKDVHRICVATGPHLAQGVAFSFVASAMYEGDLLEPAFICPRCVALVIQGWVRGRGTSLLRQ